MYPPTRLITTDSGRHRHTTAVHYTEDQVSVMNNNEAPQFWLYEKSSFITTVVHNLGTVRDMSCGSLYKGGQTEAKEKHVARCLTLTATSLQSDNIKGNLNKIT